MNKKMQTWLKLARQSARREGRLFPLDAGRPTIIKEYCVLDIETIEINPKKPDPETSRTGLIGLLVVKGSVEGKQNRYYAFRPNEAEKFLRRIAKSRGPIVGFNTLNFDYRVLSRLFKIDMLIQRTVDLFPVVTESAGEMISLDKLSRANFETGKLLKGGSVSKLLAEKRWDEVAAYNKTDCVLTGRLYELMISDGRYRTSEKGNYSVDLRSHVVRAFAKQYPTLTSQEWRKNLKHLGQGYIVVRLKAGGIGYCIERLCVGCDARYKIKASFSMPPLKRYMPFPKCPLCRCRLVHPHAHDKLFSENIQFERVEGRMMRIDSTYCKKCQEPYSFVSEEFIRGGLLRADCGFEIRHVGDTAQIKYGLCRK